MIWRKWWEDERIRIMKQMHGSHQYLVRKSLGVLSVKDRIQSCNWKVKDFLPIVGSLFEDSQKFVFPSSWSLLSMIYPSRMAIHWPMYLLSSCACIGRNRTFVISPFSSCETLPSLRLSLVRIGSTHLNQREDRHGKKRSKWSHLGMDTIEGVVRQYPLSCSFCFFINQKNPEYCSQPQFSKLKFISQKAYSKSPSFLHFIRFFPTISRFPNCRLSFSFVLRNFSLSR